MEQACFAYDMVTVPLYDTLGDVAVAFIVKQTNIGLVLVDDAAKASCKCRFIILLYIFICVCL
jgi:long-subunit acyl-CoA synthetase (AMP-forming)